MAHERDREPMRIPRDDDYVVWKDGKLHDRFATFEDAWAVCDRGHRTKDGNFEVWHKVSECGRPGSEGDPRPN
jgi:hypothetical protein